MGEEYSLTSGMLCNDVPLWEDIDMTTSESIKNSFVKKQPDLIDQYKKAEVSWRNRDLSTLDIFDANSATTLSHTIGFPSYIKDKDSSSGLDDLSILPTDHEWHLINGCFQSTKQEDWQIP